MIEGALINYRRWVYLTFWEFEFDATSSRRRHHRGGDSRRHLWSIWCRTGTGTARGGRVDDLTGREGGGADWCSATSSSVYYAPMTVFWSELKTSFRPFLPGYVRSIPDLLPKYCHNNLPYLSLLLFHTWSMSFVQAILLSISTSAYPDWHQIIKMKLSST